jgi:hypothetical protein
VTAPTELAAGGVRAAKAGVARVMGCACCSLGSTSATEMQACGGGACAGRGLSAATTTVCATARCGWTAASGVPASRALAHRTCWRRRRRSASAFWHCFSDSGFVGCGFAAGDAVPVVRAGAGGTGAGTSSCGGGGVVAAVRESGVACPKSAGNPSSISITAAASGFATTDAGGAAGAVACGVGARLEAGCLRCCFVGGTVDSVSLRRC